MAGPAGELLKRLLDAEGVRYTPMPVTGWTRENLNVLEEVSGRQFRFCMPGATLGDHEWPIFLDWVRQLRPAPDFLVASGSLPPGVPVDFYARLAAVGRQIGSRVVLDTSGAPLARAVEEGVYLLKPSLQEFQALMGEHEGDESHLASLAATVVKRGWCEILVLSLGAGGALWVTASERERLASPAVRVKSSVGAGDSMVAGIVLSLAQGRAAGRGRPLRGRRRRGGRDEPRNRALPSRRRRATLSAGDDVARVEGEEDPMKARDVMTPNPITVTPQATLAEVWDLMREADIRHVPVVRRAESWSAC